MASRKELVRDRNHYASLIAKLEGGKSSIKIGDMRQAMKLIVILEAVLIKAGYKSALMVLRREAVQKFKSFKGNEYGRAKASIIK